MRISYLIFEPKIREVLAQNGVNNAPKSLNNVKNKLNENGVVLYGDLKELESIKTHANAFTPLANSQKQQAQTRGNLLEPRAWRSKFSNYTKRYTKKSSHF